VGCSGWQYDSWKKKFYPENVTKQKWLQFYSEKFATVEINNTFYKFTKKRTLTKWYNQTPKKFYFTLKASRVITRYKKFNDTKNISKRALLLPFGCFKYFKSPVIPKCKTNEWFWSVLMNRYFPWRFVDKNSLFLS
jgi:uncharacterized protein YecE (DUF72 family)